MRFLKQETNFNLLNFDFFCIYLLEREKKGQVSSLETSKPTLSNEEYHDDQEVAWFEPNELFPKLPDDELIEAQYNVEFEGSTQ